MQRGIPRHVAIGIAGNMAVESAGFQTDVNEFAPVVPGSRGGYGLNQWTGPRRRQYEAFAADRGAPTSDLGTQLDFTVWELQNTEASAGKALMGAQSPEDAARIYSEKFLRPGVPHMDRRLSETARIAGTTYEGTTSPQEAPQQPWGQRVPMDQWGQPQRQQNALSEPQLRMGNNLLDPRAFMTERAPVNRLKFT